MKKIILLIIEGSIVLYVSFFISNPLLKQIDHSVYTLLHLLPSTLATPFFIAVTQFGGAIVILFIMLVFLMLKKKSAVPYCLHIIVLFMINTVLKESFQIARPDGVQLVEVFGYSFPSAHAMMSTALYSFLLVYMKEYHASYRYSLVVKWLVLFIIVLVCLSRVYLGVHYFSDVFIGALLSFMYIQLYVYIHERKIV